MGLRWRSLSIGWKAVTAVAGPLIAAAGLYFGALVPLFCLWPRECAPNVRIDLTASRFNPRGHDDPRHEYVCLVNEDDRAVRLTGWVLRDARADVNVLPAFSLRAGGGVRVHAGAGTDSATDLYGDRGAPQWNNDADAVQLRDATGQEIASAAYGPRKDGDGRRACA